MAISFFANPSEHLNYSHRSPPTADRRGLAPAGACGRHWPDCTPMTDSVSRIRVLIAEDDDNARSLLIDLLGTLGHTVVAEVSTGREAFERAKDVVPDVVLLDVHMPDGS